MYSFIIAIDRGSRFRICCWKKSPVSSGQIVANIKCILICNVIADQQAARGLSTCGTSRESFEQAHVRIEKSTEQYLPGSAFSAGRRVLLLRNIREIELRERNLRHCVQESIQMLFRVLCTSSLPLISSMAQHRFRPHL